MRRFITLTIVVGLLAIPLAAGAGPIDPVPLMKVSDFKEAPGTPVPITPPAPLRPCAPLLKGELPELPGLPVAINVPVVPCYVPVMKGPLTELPGTIVPVHPPRLPVRR
jgi:hypothetical protein